MDHAMSSAPKSSFKTFFPLIAVLSIILLATAATMYWAQSWELMSGMRYFMGFFFLLFGFFKTLDWSGFIGMFRQYDVVAKRSKAYAAVYPVIELALALAYFGNYQPFWTNVLTAVIMFVGAIGVIQAVSKKQRIHCACLGAVVKLPMTTVTIIEDLGMGAMALAMIWMM